MNISPLSPISANRYRLGERFAAVQSALTDRARRREYVSAALLAEPAWDILLELYAFQLLQQPVTAAEVSDRLHVPSTTSDRWMKMLEADLLIARWMERPVGVRVALTPKGVEAMDRYFSAIG